MKPDEIVIGYVFGQMPCPLDEDPGRSCMPTAGPRAALEEVVREALQRAPCGIAFSGGRDSSVVLAIATHVARRDGLPEPVPITRQFPQSPESDEQTWQEAVVRHLRLRDWHRVELHDELDVIGPLAARHLVAHGVVWPPTIAGDVPMVDAVRGGSLLDGEGGDQVLGVDAHRVAPAASLLRSPRPLRRRRIVAALRTFEPASRRGRARASSYPRPWLRPRGVELVIDALQRMEKDRPLSYSTSVRRIARRRGEMLADANRRIFAAQHGVAFVSPLLDSRFVDEIARDGGHLGRGSRTAVLRRLAADLLPDAVLARTSKAFFNNCYMARHTRDFATNWRGGTFDPELIDEDALRRAWLSDPPVPATAALLQEAWLAASHRASAV